ncbi:MAG: Cys-tRNA(Pro)/Cys-tRNA(Cys) deacylase [Chloroflexi bacterium]|jgi:Cys-tRNA(Pro)/Cys-tRNA(Cys) deacylase|nr:Cys-tRNA(Pro)/Cys-tRNA(Cys) deacylase [Chloroflexota bacterium]
MAKKVQTPKTNAMRALDARKVAYQTFSYSSEIHSADGAAEALGVDPAMVYKTLVVLPESGQGRPLLIMVPGNHELDLKVLGQAVGEKKLRMASQREAESLTGLLVGGISALALLNKNFRIFVDEAALELPQMYVNGGQRGLNLRLSPQDLLSVTGALPVPTQ